MPHSVEEHLRIEVSEYDRVIRTFIPGYEAMLGTIALWLERVVPANARVVDLGGGTGSLAHLLAKKIPRAVIEIWDIDRKMLAVAKQRLSQFGDRILYTDKSFVDPLPHCDAVVSTLALHHIRLLEEKANIYTNIFHALAPKGVFLNGDITLAADPEIQEGTRAAWREFMKRTGMSDEEITKHFREWAEEDTYFSLRDEFAALTRAGFTDPECFWKEGPATVFGAAKP